MKKIFLIMFAMFMAAINVFADKESDAFLKKVALMKYDGTLMSGANINITTSYEKKVFTVSMSLDGKIEDVANQFFNKSIASLIRNDDILVIEILSIERQNKGFVENMLKSNAGFRRVVNIKATGQTYEQQMKAKQIKNINLADTVNVDKMEFELQLRTVNAGLPIAIDDEISMNKFSIEEDKCLVLEFLTKEKKATIEQIDDMKDIFEIIYVNVMKSSMYAQYVGMSSMDVAIRFRSATREKYTDIYIPFSKAEELFDPNNQIDSTDVVMATFVYAFKRKLPIKMNEEEVFKDISYKDKTISCVIELKGKSAEVIYNFDKIGKLELICSDYTILTKMLQEQSLPGWKDIKIRQVYRNAEWGKDIIYETSTKKDIDYMNNAGLKDSILIAQLAELNNLYRKSSNGVKEVHEYDGNVFTIKILLSKRNMAPQSYIRLAGTSEFIDVLQKDYKRLCLALYRRKKNIRYVAKNTVTGKEESIIIPYEIIY